MAPAAWSSATLAVIIPTSPTHTTRSGWCQPEGTTREPVPPENGDSPLEFERWDLTGFLPKGSPVPNPNHALIDRIRDDRLRWSIPVRACTCGRGCNYAFYTVEGASFAQAGNMKSRRRSVTIPEGLQPGGTLPGMQIRAVEVVHALPFDVHGSFEFIQVADPSPAKRSKNRSAQSEETAPASLSPSFAILHINLARIDEAKAKPDPPPVLDDPSAAAAFFAHPARQTDNIKGQPRVRADIRDLNALLEELGLNKINEIQPDTVAGREGDPILANRPYVISHLVPERGDIPSMPAVVDPVASWPREKAWAWRMADGNNLAVNFAAGRDPGLADAGGFWWGRTWCRVSRDGCALVATNGAHELPTTDAEGRLYYRKELPDLDLEILRVKGFAHSILVDLALLSLWSADFLLAQSRELALSAQKSAFPTRLADQGFSSGEGLRAKLERSLRNEERFAHFRSERWFLSAPRSPHLSRFMLALQEAMGSTVLFDELEAEQQSASRISELRHGLAAIYAAETEQVRRDATQSELNRQSSVFGFLAAGVVLPTFVFSTVAILVSAPQRQWLAWFALAVSIVLALLTGVAVSSYTRRGRSRSIRVGSVGQPREGGSAHAPPGSTAANGDDHRCG